MTYKLHPTAEAELNRAALYYAKQASLSIALAFVAEFERVAELLEGHQQLGTKSKADLRVHPFRRFPYSLVYRESQDGPLVYAVAHHKKAPGYWLARVPA